MTYKKMQKLINSHGLNEDPSPVARASRSLILGQTEGLLSYKATNSLIASSNCCFSISDIDSHLLELIKVYQCTSSSSQADLGYASTYECMFVCVYLCMYKCEHT